MKKPWSYLLPLLFVAVLSAAFVGLNELGDRKIAAIGTLLLTAGYVLWSARFGQMRDFLPGIRAVDFIAFALLIGVTVYFIAALESQAGFPLYAMIVGSYLVWGVFSMVRILSYRGSPGHTDHDDQSPHSQ